MSTWTPQRGVLLHRPRARRPAASLPAPQEPPFPWIVLPLLGVGFLAFFAALALMGTAWHPWQLGLMALGIVLLGAGLALAERFVRRTL